MYSFYGGRPGNSFVIITTYKSIEDMVEKFQQGPNYTAVHYDEYVMIDNENRNYPDNGKIYRRGYNFNNQETGGAEYVGCIAGPSGDAPTLELTTIENINDIIENNSSDLTKQSSGSYSLNNENLVPGKYEEENENNELEQYFNDEIVWKSCSIRSADNSETNAYIGFQIPYPVFDFEAEQVSPYLANNKINSKKIQLSRIDNNDHPFYQKWRFEIPKATKGDCIKNLRVIKADSNVIYPETWTQSDIDQYNQNQKQIFVYDYYDYTNYESGFPKSDSPESGNEDHPDIYYLADYNMIKNISIDNQGKLTFNYTDGSKQESDILLKWINSVNMDSETGELKIIYNQKDDEGNPITSSYILDYIKDIDLNENGSLTFKYTNEDNNKTTQPKIKWVKNITIDNENGAVKVKYNTTNEQNQIGTLKWITGATLDEDGTLYLQCNNGDSIETQNQKIQWIKRVYTDDSDNNIKVEYNTNEDPVSIMSNVKWVENVQLTNDGKFNVYYTDNPDTPIAQENITITWPKEINLEQDGTLSILWNNNDGTRQDFLNPKIKWITGINIDQEGTVDILWNNGSPTSIYKLMKWISNASIDSNTQKIKITYNDNSEELIGEPINYIKEMAISNNRLLVLYSDPQKQEQGNINYNNRPGWQSIGQFSQTYDYNPGDIISDLQVTKIIGFNPQAGKIKFTVPLIGSFDPIINTVLLNQGTLTGRYRNIGDQTDTRITTTMTSSNTSITKTPTGLQFLVNTPYPVLNDPIENDQVILSIQDMELQFTFYSQQGG